MLRLMREEDCLEAARLHMQEFYDSDLLPSLGAAVLRIIYRGMLKDRKNAGYVAEEDGKITGFITGSEDTEKLFRECMRKEFIPLSCHMLRALISKPSLIARTIQAFNYNKKADIGIPAELTSIAVKAGHKRRGLGRGLAGALINDMKNRGIDKIRVVANKSNTEANSFYRKIGFIYKRTFTFCNREMNLYVMNL